MISVYDHDYYSDADDEDQAAHAQYCNGNINEENDETAMKAAIIFDCERHERTMQWFVTPMKTSAMTMDNVDDSNNG